MGSSSSRSSGGSSGDDWHNVLFFLNYTLGDKPPTQIKSNNLRNYFERIGTKNEKILHIDVFKTRLGNLSDSDSSIDPFWHEFIIIKSTNYFWSFEKHNFGICVQCSRHISDVKDKFKGERRKNKVKGHELYLTVSSEYTVFDVFNWIYTNNCLNSGYNVATNNCKNFVSKLRMKFMEPGSAYQPDDNSFVPDYWNGE